MFKRTDLAGIRSHRSFFFYNDYEFEYACKYLLDALKDYSSVQVTPKGPKGGDDGIDLKICTEGREVTIYGQCKQWRGRYHGLGEAILQLKGRMAIDGIEKGIFIATVEANAYERNLARRSNIEIIDAHDLDEMIDLYQAKNPVKHTVQLRHEFPATTPVEERFSWSTLLWWMVILFVCAQISSTLFYAVIILDCVVWIYKVSSGSHMHRMH